MNTLSEIKHNWTSALQESYSARETAIMLRLIMLDVFEWESADFLLRVDEELPVSVQKELDTILARLLTNEPVQHIIGFTYFDELKIEVSPDVLIPRPETEELVHWICEDTEDGFKGAIEDWCTGSGCISLALKHRLPQAIVRGYDISTEALKMARKNADNLQLDVYFQYGDALSVNGSEEEVSIIVSNPPYVPISEKVDLHRNVRDFEPGLALFVPDDKALLFYEAITQMAAKKLAAGGRLYFELHEDFALQTGEMVRNSGEFDQVEIRKDMIGKSRMLKAVRK